LDDCGRVVDFSEIKGKVKAWVDEHLDHGMILDRSDYTTVRLVEQLNGQKIYLMDGPPSAENIAALILRQAKALLESEFSKVKVESVAVEETDGSGALCTV
jgi:6-pyruvoyltetrahydropterin/6-carboxytetrahydropterin synthase